MESTAIPLHARAFAVLQANAKAPPGREVDSDGGDEYAGARSQMLFNYAVCAYYVAESKVEVLSDSSGTWVTRRASSTAGDATAVAAGEAREYLRRSMELLVPCPAAARCLTRR